MKGSSFIRQKDRVLIIPDKQQVKHAFTGYDLLSNLMIPGIDVDRKKGVVATMEEPVTNSTSTVVKWTIGSAESASP